MEPINPKIYTKPISLHTEFKSDDKYIDQFETKEIASYMIQNNNTNLAYSEERGYHKIGTEIIKFYFANSNSSTRKTYQFDCML